MFTCSKGEEKKFIEKKKLLSVKYIKEQELAIELLFVYKLEMQSHLTHVEDVNQPN